METIKQRVLHMRQDGYAANQDIEDALGKLPGVLTVRFDRGKGLLAVTYNLLETDLKTLRLAMDRTGLRVESGVVGRLKDRMVYFMEENERSNLTAVPRPCCSHTVPRVQNGVRR